MRCAHATAATCGTCRLTEHMAMCTCISPSCSQQIFPTDRPHSMHKNNTATHSTHVTTTPPRTHTPPPSLRQLTHTNTRTPTHLTNPPCSGTTRTTRATSRRHSPLSPATVTCSAASCWGVALISGTMARLSWSQTHFVRDADLLQITLARSPLWH